MLSFFRGLFEFLTAFLVPPNIRSLVDHPVLKLRAKMLVKVAIPTRPYLDHACRLEADNPVGTEEGTHGFQPPCVAFIRITVFTAVLGIPRHQSNEIVTGGIAEDGF